MYKIKFLISKITDNDTGETTSQYVENLYSDGLEINRLAKNWKALGFMRVISVDVQKGSDLSYTEVIELLYPEERKEPDETIIRIDAKQKAIKNELLGKLAIKDNGDEPKEDDTKDDNQPTKRETMWNKAKELFESGKLEKMPAKNISNKALNELINQ